MSLLSQFFPSGGGASGANAIKTNMLLVAGGSGGSPGGGSTPCGVGAGGGGGGGGEVFEFVNYDIAPGSSITVTVGSGGATGSDGGNSCVAISDSYTFVAKGGTSGQLSGCTTCLTPIDSCSTFGHNYLSGSKSGGGGGATGQVCITPGPAGAGFNAGPGGCLRANLAGMIYCGRNYSPNLYCSGYPVNGPSPCVIACLTGCIIDYVGEGAIVRPIMGSGGVTESKSLSYSPYRGPLAFYGPGAGGGGGGGASSPGTCGGSGCPGVCNSSLCWYCICVNYGAGSGGIGGRGHCSTITGSSQIYGAGGGGGGGTYGAIAGSAPSPSCYSAYVPQIRGLGGPSGSPYGGGNGGAGSGLNPPYSIPGVFVSGSPGTPGCANTGTGGGGGGHTFSAPTGGCGGSGIVVVQYPNARAAAPAFPGACDCSPATPGYRTYRFNGPGSITLP